jgi:hypothetical protein
MQDRVQLGGKLLKREWLSQKVDAGIEYTAMHHSVGGVPGRVTDLEIRLSAQGYVGELLSTDVGHDDVGEKQLNVRPVVEDGKRCRRIVGEESGIAKFADRFGRELQHHRVILNHQNHFGGAGRYRRRARLNDGCDLVGQAGQHQKPSRKLGSVLTAEVDGLAQAYNATVRNHAPRSTNDRFDALLEQVHEALQHGRPDDARRSYAEMIAIFLDGAKEQPGFHVDMFLSFTRERHLAIDKALHDRLIAESEACIDRNDLGGLRRVIGQILDNQ